MDYKIIRYEKPIGKDGIDVTVQFTDFSQDIDTSVTFWWEKGGKPTLTDLSERLDHIAGNILREKQEELAEMAKPSVLDRETVNEILREKGYLSETEDLNDLQTKSELLATVK